ncbi:hypothetical protein BGX20_009371 [Mortierella sp. AD010]|nr:hypothetical protein BGX20_009371 [Mortierella sp. AD010]
MGTALNFIIGTTADNIAIFGNTGQLLNVFTDGSQLVPACAGCGVDPEPCSGLITIVRMLADVAINSVSQIPLTGVATLAVLPGLINAMFDATSLGSTIAIQSTYDLLEAPVSLLADIRIVSSAIATPLRHFLGGCKVILDWSIANTPTPLSVAGTVESFVPTAVPTNAIGVVGDVTSVGSAVVGGATYDPVAIIGAVASALPILAVPGL